MVNNNKSPLPYTPSPTPQPGQEHPLNLKQAAAAQSSKPYSSSRLGQLPSLTAGIGAQGSGAYSSAAASPTASFATAHSAGLSEGDRSWSGRTRFSIQQGSGGGGGEGGWAGPPPLRHSGAGGPVGEGVERVGGRGLSPRQQQQRGDAMGAEAGHSSGMRSMGNGGQHVTFEDACIEMPGVNSSSSSSGRELGSSWVKRPPGSRGVAEGIESGEGSEIAVNRAQSYNSSVEGASDDEEPDLVSVGLAGMNRAKSFADVRTSAAAVTAAAAAGGVGSGAGGGGSGNVSRRLTPSNSWREHPPPATGTPLGGTPPQGGSAVLSAPSGGSPIRSGQSYGGMLGGVGSVSGGRGAQWGSHEVMPSSGSWGQVSGSFGMEGGHTTPRAGVGALSTTPSSEIQAAPTLAGGLGQDAVLPRIYSRSRSFGTMGGVEGGEGWGPAGGQSPFVAMSRATPTEGEVPLVRGGGLHGGGMVYKL